MPARHHLAVGGAGQREVGVGVEPLGHGVHLLPPGPERPPLPLRPPPQRPVERVAVAVREPGDGEAGDACGFTGAPVNPSLLGRSNTRQVTGSPANLDRSEPPVLDLDEHLVADGAVDPGAFEQVRRHAGSPASSREHVGQRLDAGEAVGHLGELARASARRRSGCGRTASRWGCRRPRGCRRRGRPRSGSPASPRGSADPARPGPASKATAPDDRLGVTTSEVPSRDGPLGAPAARSPPTSVVQRGVRRRPRVQPGGHPRRHRVGAVRRRPRAGRTSPAARRAAPACWRPARSSRRSASGRRGPPSASCPHGWPRR